MQRQKKLTRRELLFCRRYCETRNEREASLLAGWSRTPAGLMGRTDIRAEIERLDARQAACAQEILAGYRRLAFGGAADAVSLLLREDGCTLEELEKMDLFCISSIKRVRGGTELVFYDRMKALEHLEALQGRQAGADDVRFYQALEQGAAALRGAGAALA